MAGNLTPIDLSQLPAPDVVEQIDFETIVAEMIADLQARDSTFTALLESDPAYKVIEVAAYREVLLRQRNNDACKAIMLAFAKGNDLDQIGANYDCERLTITPEDDSTIPPTPAVMEGDDAYRARIQLSMQGYSCAGPNGAYQYFAKSASGDVLDASVTSPTPGTVLVSGLSQTGNGTAPQSTIDAVTLALSADDVRPLCDTVLVQSAQVIQYSVQAVLTVLEGYDEPTVVANAIAAVTAYTKARHKNGRSVTMAMINAALGVAGVENIAHQAPGITADIVISKTQAAYCTSISVVSGGVSD
jgi:phage-related baseplate assembly protein